MELTLVSASISASYDEPARAAVARDGSPLTTWGCALSLATFGTIVLWKSSIGINWPLGIIGVVAALLLGARERYGAAGAPATVAGAWAIVIALGTTVTADDARIAVLMLASLVLLAIALVSAGQRSLDVLHIRTAFLAPFLAIALTLHGLIAELTGSTRVARSPRTAAITRSALITLPIVVVLILLLGEADPLFAAIRDFLKHIIPDDVFAQLLFFAFLFVVTLGAFGIVQGGETHVHASDASRFRTLGRMERRVLMASLATIMWMFVISAWISLNRNPAAKAGSGITYAEYVHSGFAQLSLAASIVIGVVLVTRHSWLADDPRARQLALVAIAGVVGMVAIAFMRVVGYEKVYGFTTLRIYAQAYMVVLGCMSALLAIEISRKAPSARFAFHSATAAFVVLVSCIVWNMDAWIVRQNVDRYEATGKIDTFYITALTSDDATPALVESVPRLREPERSKVIRFLRLKDTKSRSDFREWFAWNLRASASAKAAHAFHGNDIAGAAPKQVWWDD
jgi:two-component system sensor histidine kinase BaeS